MARFKNNYFSYEEGQQDLLYWILGTHEREGGGIVKEVKAKMKSSSSWKTVKIY